MDESTAGRVQPDPASFFLPPAPTRPGDAPPPGLSDENRGELARAVGAAAATEFSSAADVLDGIAGTVDPAALLAVLAFDHWIPDRADSTHDAGAAVHRPTEGKYPSGDRAEPDRTEPLLEHEVLLLQAFLLRRAAPIDAPWPTRLQVDASGAALRKATRTFVRARVGGAANARDDVARAWGLLAEQIRIETQVGVATALPEQAERAAVELWQPLESAVEGEYGLRVEGLARMWREVRRQATERFARVAAVVAAVPIAADHFGLAARVRASLPELADQYDAARLARVEPGGFLWRDIVDPYARLALDEIKTAITWTTEEFAAAYSAGGAKAPEPTSLDAVLARWSLSWGDLADKRCDYFLLDNPSRLRPLVRLDGNRWMLAAPSAPAEYLLDLLEVLPGGQVSWERYHRRRADFLEEGVARALSDALPEAYVAVGSQFRLPEDPATQYENDAVAVLDAHAVIAESKSGAIQSGADRGGEASVRGTIDHLVAEPARQAERFARVISERRVHEFTNKEGLTNVVDATRVTRIVRMSVTLDHLGTLGARWAHLVDADLLDASALPTPSMHLFELQNVCAVLSRPTDFLHYLAARERSETELRLRAEELDLLALYLRTGLSGESERAAGPDERAYGLGTFLRPFLRRYWAGEAVDPPRRTLTPWWRSLLDLLEHERRPGWTRASEVLLDVPDRLQREFERDVAEVARERPVLCEHGHPRWEHPIVHGTVGGASSLVVAVPVSADAAIETVNEAVATAAVCAWETVGQEMDAVVVVVRASSTTPSDESTNSLPQAQSSGAPSAESDGESAAPTACCVVLVGADTPDWIRSAREAGESRRE